MSEIRFVNAAKRYAHNIEVIRNLELTVHEGEFMVLVGPSGCAKSTTLRMVAGLESITEGDLFIGNQRANDLTPAERNISMVFQSYALFPNMTVRGNLSFGMQIRKQPREDIDRDTDRVAAMLGLEPLLDRRPRQLSGGQAQRVALGRAMIRRPAAFLFDEPLSNLDAELRVQMRGEISQMQKRLGTTTVYVTHDQVEAMTMGDRIAVMDRGRIMQVGSPIELYDRPSNLFVASFIGSPRMNFLKVRDGMCLGSPVTGCPNTKDELTAGLRPEHISIHDGANDDGDFRATGVVQQIEDLGHEALVCALIPATGETVTLRAPGEIRSSINAESEIDLAMRLDKISFFDGETGERVS